MTLKAFVLMPFDDEFDVVYEQLIEPPLVAAGFEVTRADLSINQQQILKDIVNCLAEADLVIVDVTGLNGNVMYELGLAHAMGRRTVIITKAIDELPFDLRSYRANAYSTEFNEAPKLVARLSEIAAGVIDGSAEFGNPVLDFAPEFLGRPDQVSQSPTRPTSESPAELHDVEDLGLLDYAVLLAESSEEIVSLGNTIGDATTNIGNKIEQRTEQLGRTSKNLGDKAAPVLRALMKDIAKDFDGFTAELEEANPRLETALQKMGQSANGLARTRGAATPEEKEKIRDEIASLTTAEETFGGAFDSINGFAKILAELPEMEQTLTRSAKRSAAAVTATAETIKMGKSEFARARGLFEERLAGLS